MTAEVLALNVAIVAAAAMLTDAGTLKAELLLVRPIVTPPAGAGAVKVTAQVLEEFGPTVLGLHASEDSSTDATRFTVA